MQQTAQNSDILVSGTALSVSRTIFLDCLGDVRVFTVISLPWYRFRSSSENDQMIIGLFSSEDGLLHFLRQHSIGLIYFNQERKVEGYVRFFHIDDADSVP